MTAPFAFALTIGAIVLLDIVLSGDNALVIGAAANKLPRARRGMAIILGGVVAAVLRIALTAVASELFQIQLLQAIGGVLLFLVAVRILWPESENLNVRARTGLLAAMATIIIADFTMSLDNILAIAALARGNILALVIGLAISMLVLFTASAFIARLMDLLPWLLDVAAVIIAFTAAQLFLDDPIIHKQLGLDSQTTLIVEGAVVVLILVIDLVLRLVLRRKSKEEVEELEELVASAEEERDLEG